MKTKNCIECGEDREYNFFGTNKFNEDGLYNTCLICQGKEPRKVVIHKGQFKKKPKDGNGNYYTRANYIRFIGSNAWRTLRYEILKESDRTCCVCGRSRREHNIALQIDHIEPVSINWARRLDKDNLQILCDDCNIGKGNKDTIDWR